jgi:hypothetical protein
MDTTAGGFGASRERFGELLGYLAGDQAARLDHFGLEQELGSRARELVRQLYQDHLDLRAARETRLAEVRGADGAAHRSVEAGHHRPLITVFGGVGVERLAYRKKGAGNLHPADAALNLPGERHSHGLRELAAVESTRGSYQEATAAIRRATGVQPGKRQAEELTRRAAADFASFYATQARPEAEEGDLLVISADGKGIVMRPGALRPATARAARAAAPKLKTRLSKGEKRNRKRMAELATVYDAAPAPRCPADILSGEQTAAPPPPAPAAKGKWLTASITQGTASVLGQAFDEAERRDPAHSRTWVALAGGNNHQIDRIKAEASARGITVTIVTGIVHVLEYLWDAAWCFFPEGDARAEAWVRDKGLDVLSGKAGIAAASIRRKATRLRLSKPGRAKADQCASYLISKKPYLDYPTALASGWPIATGVIEGACRHIVRDRFDITGARWSLEGAEAVLKLRALRANGDWAGYWTYHLQQEHQRVHETRYANGAIPQAA